MDLELCEAGVKLVLALPVDRFDAPEEFLTARAIAAMAAFLEERGVWGCFVTDHPAPPRRWLDSGGHHSLEPTVSLTAAAAATSDLRLMTNIYVLGYRNPLLAAKALSSLDVVSEGRAVIGIGAGYLRGEFEALGASFESRADSLEAAVEVLRSAWSGRPVTSAGDGWAAREISPLPQPTQRPGPPIWIAGNSGAARRRAASFGDGWIPFPAPSGLARVTKTAAIENLEDLARGIAKLREECEAVGRPMLSEVCFPPFSPPGSPGFAEELFQCGELGVTTATITVGSVETREHWVEEVDRILEAVSP